MFCVSVSGWDVGRKRKRENSTKEDTDDSDSGSRYNTARHRDIFLAHRIRISEILPWDRKSYLIQAILPRLSCEGYIYWLYWNSRTWLSSDVIVMFKCIMCICLLAYSGISGSLF